MVSLNHSVVPSTSPQSKTRSAPFKNSHLEPSSTTSSSGIPVGPKFVFIGVGFNEEERTSPIS